MGLAISGAISNPYEGSDAGSVMDVEPIMSPPPTPWPSPPPTATASTTTTTAEPVPSCCPDRAKMSVGYKDAMFTAKVAFVVGAVSGLLLANFLRHQTQHGQ